MSLKSDRLELGSSIPVCSSTMTIRGHRDSDGTVTDLRLKGHYNGVARMLKDFTHQRETAGLSSDFPQAGSFYKLELLLKERICSQRELILSF